MSPFFTPFCLSMIASVPFLQARPASTLLQAKKRVGLWALVLSAILALNGTAHAQAFGNPATVQEQPSTAVTPFLGGFGPTDPPRLSPSAGYDPLPPELSETVALPFLSFLIIEPDPIVRNGIPSEIEKLVKTQKYAEAIERIDAILAKTPRNVQLRFVKARIQIEMRQYAPAQKTLTEITQQFPELAEPYNNLAALAANQGQWIEARDYLELALKLKPTYAIASANLGEVYTRLAARAYLDAAKERTNQREYQRRAAALIGILKTPNPNSKNAVPSSTLNPQESKSQNGASTPQNQ